MTREKKPGAKKILEGKAGVTRIYTSERSFPDEITAKDAFGQAKDRLFHVDSWGKIPGPENAVFLLYHADGTAYNKETKQRVYTRPVVGDYIKTLLPGPLPEDWVTVTDLQESDVEASFTVRPSHDPTDKEHQENATQHFFKSSARSTIKVQRKGHKLVASETGTHESINNRDPEAGNRKVLNTLVSEAGWLFVQKMQWENVTDYIVGNSNPERTS